MPHINLLPWREEQRRQRNKDFGITCVVFAVLMLITIGAVHYWFQDQIGKQNQRNQFIEKEIAELDKAIEAIKNLDAEREALLARMQIIQELQASRPEIVHLFDEIVVTLPEGIFYKKIVQKGRKLAFTGVAQSNARVSSLMRNVEDSDWIENPKLQEIKREQQTQGEQETLRLSNFVLNTSQKAQKVVVPGGESGQGESQ